MAQGPATAARKISTPRHSRDQLLKAALQVFAEKGFAGATTREIAERAGAFQPQIAYFFSGKEALWKEVVESTIPQCDEMLDKLLSENISDVRVRIERVVRDYLTFAAHHPEWVSIMIQAGLKNSDQSAWLVERHIRSRTERLYRALTGRSLSTANVQEARLGLSLISTLSGAAAIFPEALYAKGTVNIDAADPAFIEDHIRVVTVALTAVVDAIFSVEPYAARKLGQPFPSQERLSGSETPRSALDI